MRSRCYDGSAHLGQGMDMEIAASFSEPCPPISESLLAISASGPSYNVYLGVRKV